MISLKAISLAAILGTAFLASGGTPAAATEILDTHVHWVSVIDWPSCGVRTTMNDGGKLLLEVHGHQIDLRATDPDWSKTEGETYPVSLVVDGHKFTGEATAEDEHTLVIEDLATDFIDAFIAGYYMKADFDDDRWNVNLIGSGGAATDMMACVKATRALGV